MEMIMDTQSNVRQLNDQWRCFGRGRGSLMLTSGVHNLGLGFVANAVAAVRTFDAFNYDNDPHGEHDFGAFTVADERLFFKIDYYDLDLQGHSPDAADPALTHRILTIMLASEY
jgi:Protein of unknown function (DUF3768)